MLWVSLAVNCLGLGICGAFVLRHRGKDKLMIALAVGNLLFVVRAIILLNQ
jgi:hypothetical protein